ncbi:hypothetical protein HAX54_030648 [Datura stramonium]|uniref:Uncharacterized protein n=1 Tax=Datura stramonium TaxID=4076 RepID=A0ABS8VBG6_DATST|nr:hypothetical protein [Datura stramonium]
MVRRDWFGKRLGLVASAGSMPWWPDQRGEWREVVAIRRKDTGKEELVSGACEGEDEGERMGVGVRISLSIGGVQAKGRRERGRSGCCGGFCAGVVEMKTDLMEGGTGE